MVTVLFLAVERMRAFGRCLLARCMCVCVWRSLSPHHADQGKRCRRDLRRNCRKNYQEEPNDAFGSPVTSRSVHYSRRSRSATNGGEARIQIEDSESDAQTPVGCQTAFLMQATTGRGY
ncbi:hypothetical protein F4780DRAFT_723105 [Xylariomycetidae sp. FL0641]|nr:hypothetical protein F4780DRAFT_723105 [Xylariomycetidae sp. FL0641]